VEACLTYANEENKTRFIKGIANSQSLQNLVKHKYGNYVIQCALDKAILPADRMFLVKAIKTSLPLIHDKKIRNKWENNILVQKSGLTDITS
jgi:hypothetical protein